MKSILVMGAGGFIGKHLLKKLKAYDIYCFIKPGNSLEGNYNIIYGDITHKEDVQNATKNIDIVINLIAPNTQLESVNNKVIIEGTRNLISAVKVNHVKKLIVLSSVAGYRKTIDNYGKAKKEADTLLLNSGLEVIILKPTMVYGRGGFAFEKMLSSLTRIPFFAFVIGDGRYKIQPTYINDMVDIIIGSIIHDKPGIQSFDVGGPYPIEYDLFISKILKILGTHKLIIHIPLPLALSIVRFVKLFLKDTAWDTDTIRRIAEDISIDINTTQKRLNIKLTDYDIGLKEVLA
jgi:nucleoside-diphosphate-sugar epimerase